MVSPRDELSRPSETTRKSPVFNKRVLIKSYKWALSHLPGLDLYACDSCAGNSGRVGFGGVHVTVLVVYFVVVVRECDSCHGKQLKCWCQLSAKSCRQ